MTAWDSPADFGRNCLAVHERFRDCMCKLGKEVSFDTETCLAVLVVLHENAKQNNRFGIQGVTRAVRDCFKTDATADETRAEAGVRHALAHHNIELRTNKRGEIRALRLCSKKDGAIWWRGEITVEALPEFLDRLRKLWPKKGKRPGS